MPSTCLGRHQINPQHVTGSTLRESSGRPSKELERHSRFYASLQPESEGHWNDTARRARKRQRRKARERGRSLCNKKKLLPFKEKSGSDLIDPLDLIRSTDPTIVGWPHRPMNRRQLNARATQCHRFTSKTPSYEEDVIRWLFVCQFRNILYIRIVVYRVGRLEGWKFQPKQTSARQIATGAYEEGDMAVRPRDHLEENAYCSVYTAWNWGIPLVLEHILDPLSRGISLARFGLGRQISTGAYEEGDMAVRPGDHLEENAYCSMYTAWNLGIPIGLECRLDPLSRGISLARFGLVLDLVEVEWQLDLSAVTARLRECGGPAPIPEYLFSWVPQVLCELGTCVCSGLLPVQWYHRGLVVFLDTLALGESCHSAEGKTLDLTFVAARLRAVVMVGERRLIGCGLTSIGVPWWWHGCVCVSVVVPRGGRRRTLLPRPGRDRPTSRDRISYHNMSWHRDQKAALASVTTIAEGSVLHVFGNLVIRISVIDLYGFGICVCSGLVPVQWYRRGLVVFLGTLALGESCHSAEGKMARVLVVVLPVEVCHGVGTVVIVVGEQRLTGCGLTGCGVTWWWHGCVCVSVVVPRGGRTLIRFSSRGSNVFMLCG
ncbi:hypothetical protein Taro_012079 [Colocasia esculenta]|uniref:Uncharacterized protein n=1 Tax=Colocasia esculenta TaxID=4460 RepID=A0A843UCI5_COLES|nr:hypothetical protein [Colocasia esculenta]